MEKKHLTASPQNNKKEDSSQNIHKPKIFLIKKIRENFFLSSHYLYPFIRLRKKDKNSNYNNGSTIINYINNINPLDSILSFYDINKIILEIINNQKYDSKLSVNLKFNYFRKSLDIKYHKRKTEIDCLLKKCKAKFEKAFHEILFKSLKVKDKNYKLPRNFVINININFNKKYLNYKMIQIYKEYKIFVNIDRLKIALNNIKFKLFLYLINKTYKELFQEYLKSKKFIDDCEIIDQKEGLEIGLLFRYVSLSFVDYYLLGKGKQKHC